MDMEEVLADEFVEDRFLWDTEATFGSEEGEVLAVQRRQAPQLEEMVVGEADMTRQRGSGREGRAKISSICFKGQRANALEMRVRLVDGAAVLVTVLGTYEASETARC